MYATFVTVECFSCSKILPPWINRASIRAPPIFYSMSVASKHDELAMEPGLAGPEPTTPKKAAPRSKTWTGYEVANWEKAQQQRQAESNMYYKGKQISYLIDVNYFKTYGPGIYLFFKFVWKVSLLFLLLALVSLVPMIWNFIKGNAFQNNQNTLQFIITKASIGNYKYVETSQNSYQQSITNKIINVSMDLVMCCMYVAFYFYWEWKSDKVVQQINEQVKLQSHKTIQVVSFPPSAKEKDIQDFMAKFGDVAEVAQVRSYSDQIYYSKEIYELKMEIVELQMMKNATNDQGLDFDIENLEAKLANLEKDMVEQTEDDQQILKFYVQFETRQQRNQVLKKFRPYQKWLRCCTSVPSELLLHGQQVEITESQTEPTGIIWENVHVTWTTRWLRAFLQLMIIVVVSVGGFILISFLNVLIPPSETDLQSQVYTWETIQEQTDTKVIYSWCIKNFSLGNSDYSQLCSAYWSRYVISIALTMAISVAIIVFKYIVKIVMIFIAKFQRYASHSDQSITIMTNLLITYTTTTVLITFLMQANVFKLSVKSFISNFIRDPAMLDNLAQLNEYSDLSSDWYRDIGYQIWFNMLTLCFIPHAYMPLIHLLLEKVQARLAQGEKLHRKMCERVRLAQFEIEDNYANVLLLILIGFVFGGGSPMTIFITFVGLFLRYAYFKYVFIRHCRIPRTINQALNDRVLTILKIILLLRFLISIYMYGANGIFAMEKSTFHKWTETLSIPFFSSIFVIVSRITLTWYYSIAALALIAIIVFKGFIFDCLLKACKNEESTSKSQSPSESSHQGTEQDEKSSEHDSSEAHMTSLMSQRILSKSYKLENNPDYVEILALMKERHQSKLKPATSNHPLVCTESNGLQD